MVTPSLEAYTSSGVTIAEDMKQTAVVILNWNGLQHLQHYLPSVVRTTPEVDIVVADNGSTDESVAVVKEQFPVVRLIELGHNYGFADGYNRTVMALPGRATDVNSRGCNLLIRNRKAQLVLSGEDIARELMWEAHRRTDLIRLGLYHTSDYLWPYKGGDSYSGQAFPQYRCIFSIPPTELAANDRLVQNPGY